MDRINLGDSRKSVRVRIQPAEKGEASMGFCVGGVTVQELYELLKNFLSKKKNGGEQENE